MADRRYNLAIIESGPTPHALPQQEGVGRQNQVAPTSSVASSDLSFLSISSA